MATMQVFQYTKYGGPEVMEMGTAPVPDAPAGGYRVKVHAFSFNPIDYKRRGGVMKALLPDTFPVIMGYDASGVVDAVGEGATKFKVGDEVYVRIGREYPSQGTAAEYTIVSEEVIAAKPPTFSHEEAAAVPLAGQTALQMLRRAGIKQGDKVFISGGAGGVGHYAIQLAKIYGASLVVSTASEHKHDLLKELGCDEVVDYKKQKFAEVYSDRRFDVGLDMTGESDEIAKVVKPGVTVISVVHGFSTETLRDAGLQPNLIVRFFVWLGNRSFHNAAEKNGAKLYSLLLRPNAKDLEEISGYIAEGKFRSIIKDQVFEGIQATPEAFKLCESGRATGKLAVKVV
eukprot:Hpha_TRINITY_DN16728_c0_g2::TRINITY_DN16728_c0_g2_i1::g.78343::m.78343